ncbi:MAG: [FeFe] hydrogenase H-cluster maturation GTPase HydF [Bacteroidales bacterium]|nr:[FeFe] hydrogenase H-cluster maturation GTPase HydF [Bacteroidales bacterium]
MYRPHIAVFGLRNSGKSSLINALTGQQVAIVSDVAGTTTDPVKKTMELSGTGPVVFIDTAGMDDVGDLGAQRVAASKAVIKEADLGLLLFTDNRVGEHEREWAAACSRASLPFIWVHNKSDLCPLDAGLAEELGRNNASEVCSCSAKDGAGIETLLACIQKKLAPAISHPKSLLGKLIDKDQTVVLVCPIDSEAPEGRLILPQVQTIRDVLNHQALALVLTESSFKDYMQKGLPADLIITDSQLFGWVEQWVPPSVPLTSFSVLLAHHKGLFPQFLSGTPVLSRLQDGDEVLILESCSHQVGCQDIGRVKLPNRIRSFTGKDIRFTIVAGLDSLPERIDVFALAIQCGGCMVTPRQLRARVACLLERGIPVSNYGMALAYMSGIFERAVAPFKTDPLLLPLME